MAWNQKKLHRLLLIFILVLAAFLRFYNLMWGNGYFFHPDERNMATAVAQFKCGPSQFAIFNFQFSIPYCNLHPHFFAYGQFPLYLAFFSGIIVNNAAAFISSISHLSIAGIKQPATSLSFSQAIFWLRFWSALTSTLTVAIVFFLTRQLLPFNLALLTATLVAFTPGLIQAAHFGTTESILTFFFMVIIYLSLALVNSKFKAPIEFRISALSALVMGLALATKLSALAFAAPFIAAYLHHLINRLVNLKKGLRAILVRLFGYWLFGILLFLITAATFLLASPYNILAYEDFRGITNYEISVATGATRVFYTRQFEATTPFLFQIGKIFPYALGPGIFLFGTLGFLMLLAFLIRNLWNRKNKNDEAIKQWRNGAIILAVAFFSYLIPNSLLFTKWTRFMTPILPFFTIFATYFFSQLLTGLEKLSRQSQNSKLKSQNDLLNLKTFKFWGLFSILAFCTLTLLPGIAFLAIYAKEDVRLTASRWIYQNIPSNSQVLSETANVIDIPVHLPELSAPSSQESIWQGRTKETLSPSLKPKPYSLSPVSFDFYHLDENPEIPPKLVEELTQADYIFIPSRRLFANALRRPQKYPLLARYYQLLFSGKLGFEKVAEFTSFPALIPGRHPPMNPLQVVSGNSGIMATLKAHLIFLSSGYLPDEAAEETWTVFDHPVIRIYRKTVQKRSDEYRELLGLQY